MVQSKKRWMVLILVLGCVLPGVAQTRRNVLEGTEWTYSVAAAKPDATLPNVLLLGDSITRAYAADVGKELAGKANVYYLATSASIADVRLPRQIDEYFTMMQPIHWSVVHFNNGMHGWSYTEEEYARFFPEMLAAVHAGAPGAKLVWATTTPIRTSQPSGASNTRIEARNAIAAKAIAAQHIPTDDQYRLMAAHQDLHSDDIHFNPEGSALQAHQGAARILAALNH